MVSEPSHHQDTLKLHWPEILQFKLKRKKSDLLHITQFNPASPKPLHFKWSADGVRLKWEQKVVDTTVWFPHLFGIRYWMYCSFANILQVTTVTAASLADWTGLFYISFWQCYSTNAKDKRIATEQGVITNDFWHRSS